MPKPYPREFRDDVIAVARRREGGVTLAQVAKDFGISEQCLINWLKADDVEGGRKPGATDVERAELRELKRRNRLLERPGLPRSQTAVASRPIATSGLVSVSLGLIVLMIAP